TVRQQPGPGRTRLLTCGGFRPTLTAHRVRETPMSTPRPRGASGVTYAHAEDGYFDKRGLTRTAGFWGLWGLGVAAVISGDFSGWNFGKIGRASGRERVEIS